MSGKSQAIRDFTFCRLSRILPIYRIISRSLSQILSILNLAGNGKCAKNWNFYTNVWKGDWSPTTESVANELNPSPTSPTVQIWVFISRQNLGQSGLKSPIVWDFPDMWKPGFSLPIPIVIPLKLLLNGVDLLAGNVVSNLRRADVSPHS